METPAAGEPGWGLGRDGVGVGRGAARETTRGVLWGGRARRLGAAEGSADGRSTDVAVPCGPRSVAGFILPQRKEKEGTSGGQVRGVQGERVRAVSRAVGRC